MSGTGWNCTQPAGPCTRADSLAAGASYPSITLTVTVASNAPSSVTNTATVSGGGQSNTTNDSASDVTTITTTVATPISLVQHAGKDAGTTTSATLAFPSANTAGNWVAVAIRAGITGQTFTVTDTRANTYRRAVQLNETVDQTTVAIFYAENIAGGTNTVTVSDSLTGSTLRFAIFEYAGVAATNSLDGVATAQGTGTVPNSGSATTTMSGELAIGMIATANPTIFTAGNGFIIEELVPASPNTKLIVEDRILATAGLVAASGSLASSDAVECFCGDIPSEDCGNPNVGRSHADKIAFGIVRSRSGRGDIHDHRFKYRGRRTHERKRHVDRYASVRSDGDGDHGIRLGLSAAGWAVHAQ